MDDIRLLTKVATLYYKNQLSQQEIAQRLGLSRQTVGRFLQNALHLGIVKIEIQSELSFVSELETQLEAAFNLSEVLVVSPPADTDDAVKTAIGQATAHYLQRRIKNGDILAVASGSTTLLQCALSLKRAHLPNVKIVSLTGSMPSSPSLAYTIVHIMSKAWGANAVNLPAPNFVDNAEIKASLMSDSSIDAVVKLGQQANIALFGIGVISEASSPYRLGYVKFDLLEIVRSEGGVGEICGHAFNINGELCSPEISDRTVAIELSSLRTKELSIAVGGGLWKLDAIWGALQGKYCNVLITDEAVGRALLARKQAERPIVSQQHV
jgi:deoxyribonucleoside regulator